MIVATLSAVSAFLAVGAVAAILVLAQDDDDDSSEEVRRLFALDDRDLSLAASWSQPDCYRIVLTLWAAEQEGSKGGRLDAVAIATRIHTDEWVRENGLFASALDAMQILVEDPTPGAGCTAADEDWITNLDYIEF